MKKISVYLLTFVCFITMETCKKTEDEEVVRTSGVKVYVHFDETLSGSNDKLLVDGSAQAIYWSSGDQFKLLNAGYNLMLSYANTENGLAYFNYSGDSIPSSDYIGFHAANAVVNAYNNIVCTASDVYTLNPADPDAYLTDNLLMYTPNKYTHGIDDTVIFKPAMTVLEIPLQTASGTCIISSITLKATGVSSGGAFIKSARLPDVIGNQSDFTIISEGDSITYRFSGSGLSVGTTPDTVRLLLWSKETSVPGLSGYSVSINNGYCTKTITRSTPLSNSKYYTCPVVTLPVPGVGDAYQGGTVFYIFTSSDYGYVAGETHGLVCAPADLDTLYIWAPTYTILSTSMNRGRGKANTATIVAALGAGRYAAYACDTLTLNGYSDWFLPSFFELYDLMSVLGGSIFATDTYYWSSYAPFYSSEAAYFVYNSGADVTGGESDKKVYLHVRPVRQF